MSRRRRIEVDVNKLVHSSFKVNIENDNLRELLIEFPGPSNTPYEGGIWLVRVELPESYPYSSPSVVFKTPIFHPNVDEQTGSVCLDVINQTWTPIFGLVNIFESFLPQLLAYPNAADPLNRRAAILLDHSEREYINEVKKLIAKHAKPNNNSREKIKESETTTNDDNASGDTDTDMSSLDELSDDNE